MSIKDQLKAVRDQYETLITSKPTTEPEPLHSKSICFNLETGVNGLEGQFEKSDAMLDYILETYGETGKNILDSTDKNLLPTYIEAHLLKQNITDPEGKFHKLLQLLKEADEKTLKSAITKKMTGTL